MNYQKESANRRVCEHFVINTGAGVRLWFGPFAPGEFISSLRVNFMAYLGAGMDVSALVLRAQIAAFPSSPRRGGAEDTLANFVANGRTLTSLALTSTDGAGILIAPSALHTNPGDTLSAGVGTVDLPVSFVADQRERFLCVVLDAVGEAEGAVWLVPGHSDVLDESE